jgi:hypothetical protein
MGTHMKTTIDLSDALFHSAKALAQQSQVTLRALVEEGLRRVIADSKIQKKTPFKLADARVHGEAIAISNPSLWREMETAHLFDQLGLDSPLSPTQAG